jgi:lincosamide and streptogramin A transport system ATP-binding/permease protein
MSLIKIENLTFAYPGSFDNVFENANVQLDSDWKLGFVGRNGRGKTTLFRLMLGEYEYSGRIISSVKFDYFPYEVKDKSQLTLDILTEVCPTAEEWEIIREVSYLDVDTAALYRPFSTLSNGEQTKVLLAALFLGQNNFLLIDEPTNHLDMQARKTVAGYLNKKKGFILISHDRAFLDSCVDHILSINKSDIEVKKCDFSTWLYNFENQQALEAEQNECLRKDVKRLKQAAKRTADWSDKVEKTKIGGGFSKGHIGHMSAKMMQKSKNLQNRQNKALEEKSKLLKNVEYDEQLKLYPLQYRSGKLAQFGNICIIYDGREINSPVSFDINSGDRIFLCGKNGCGKSSLLKLLYDEGIQFNGSFFKGSNLIVSVIPQDTSALGGALDDFAFQRNIDGVLFKAILQKLGFNKLQFEKDMSEYSAGQKKKVYIAASLCDKAHLYIWDEPLNYIDIYSRRQIEKLILEYQPTMLTVEHDRAFQEAVATKIIQI